MAEITVARCVALNKDNHILLLRRSSANKSRVGLWELVGGKKDDGDLDIPSALKRETREELHTELSTLTDALYTADVTSPEAAVLGRTYILHAYVGRLSTHDIVLSEEHDKSIWSPPDEVFSHRLTSESEQALHAILPSLATLII